MLFFSTTTLAAVGYTALDYFGDDLSGYADTARTFEPDFIVHEETCQPYGLDAWQCYGSAYQGVRVDVSLSPPGGGSVYSDTDFDWNYAYAEIPPITPTISGTWTATGDHYVRWDSYYLICDYSLTYCDGYYESTYDEWVGTTYAYAYVSSGGGGGGGGGPQDPLPADVPRGTPANSECTLCGNPVNAANKGKVETIIDYEAPGIQFARTWRSNIAPEVAFAGYSSRYDGRLSWGWTHSYASRVLVDSAGLPTELFRPDGSLVSLYESSPDVYLATDASGIQVRPAGYQPLFPYQWVAVLLPDGSREFYEQISCQGPPYQYRLISVVGAAGVVSSSGQTTFVLYDSACATAPTSILGPFGHTLTIQYGSVSLGGGYSVDRISGLIDPASGSIDFDYVASGNGAATGQLEYVTYQDSSYVRYHYDNANAPGYLSGITDERGIRYATFAYNANREATSTVHSGGFGGFTLSYTAGGATATDANGVTTTFGMQTAVPAERILGSITRNGQTRALVNETSGQFRLLSTTDERGVTTNFGYDTYHQTSITEAVGTSLSRTTTFDYLNDTSQLVTVVQSPSACTPGTLYRTVTTTYAANTQRVESVAESGYGLQSGTCQPVSRTTGFEYGTGFAQTHGLPTAIRGPRPGVADDVVFTYYECTSGSGSCGQISTVTNAAGHVWTYNSYDAHGRPTQITQPNGNVLTQAYDPRGRLDSVTESAGGLQRTTDYEHYANGQLEQVTDPTGAYIRYTYNDARLLTGITDNASNTIQYGYDLAGNRTSETIRDPSGTITSMRSSIFDDFNRLDTVSLPNPLGGMDIWDYDYGPTGLLELVTSPEGRVTSYDDYDALGRLHSFLDPLNQRTVHEYDAQDNPISVTDPGASVTSYEYSDLGDLIRELSPDRGTTTYTHDAAGNVLSKTDGRGVTVSYAHDALNRLLTIDYPDSGLDVAFGYDSCANGIGARCTMTDGSGSTAYQYDGYGNVSGRTITVGAITGSIGYIYNSADRLLRITYPSGRTVDYPRNSLGQVASVSTTSPDGQTTQTLASSLTYAPFGPMKTMSFGNGIALSRSYDLNYQLTGQVAGSIQNLAFGYDGDDNLTSLIDNINPSRNQTPLTYDALGRLKTAAGAYGSLSWNYDAVGNRETASGAVNETYSYAPDSNRLVQLVSGGNVRNFIYDGNGNLTGDGYYTAIYGDHNRMTEARIAGSPVGFYTYNGLGQRVKKDNGAVRLFVYDESGQLIGEYDGTGTTVQETVWLDGAELAVIADDTAYFVHTDHLDTPRAVTSGAGMVIWRWDSDPFGTTAPDEDPDGDQSYATYHSRFPGQYFDSESGLHYNYFRDYWPDVGRYVQADPIGLAGGINTYLFANGNPMRFTDATGLWPTPDTVLDVGSIIYDLYRIGKDNVFGDRGNFGENASALCADIGGAVVPFVSGGGTAVRAANKVDDAVDAVRRLGLANKSNRQLNLMLGNEQRELLRQFLGTGLPGAQARGAGFEIPAGLTKDSLEIYGEIARRAIAEGIDRSGVQAARLELVERALKALQ